MRNIRKYINDDNFNIIVKLNKIYIENYVDIGNISDNKIIIFVKNKKITINGSKLKITKLLNSEVLISGNYNNINFEGTNE